MPHPKGSETQVLIAHISKHRAILEELQLEMKAALEQDLAVLGRSSRAAVLIAGLLENYYTCAETIFVRISQYFENNLSTERWHRDLLERMTLDIPPLRPRVLSTAVATDLQELMRFRHFRRYYFGTAYDWTRLDELTVRLQRVHVPLEEDLELFGRFLTQLED